MARSSVLLPPMITRLLGPMRTVLTHRVTFGTTPGGEPVAYAVSQGVDSPLSVIDLAGRRIADAPMPGSTGAWGLQGGPDGHAWFGSYYDGRFYHWDGERVHDLGRPTPDTEYTWDLARLDDSSVLIGTYPDASLVRYHLDGRFELVRSFGTDAVKYLRALCWDPDRRVVWVAAGVAPNRVHGVYLDDPTREPLTLTGPHEGEVAHQLAYLDGRLLLVTGNRVWVADLDTLTVTEVTGGQEPTTGGGTLSAAHQGGTYLAGTGDRLLRLDLTSLEFTEVARDGQHAVLGSTVHDDTLHLFVGHQAPELLQVRDGAVRSRVAADVVATPPHMLHVIGFPSGPELVVSAGQQGQVARWDPTTDTLGTPVTVEQVESWCWYEGQLLIGGYPSASLRSWDPTSDAPPGHLISLHDSHHQSRPVAVAAGDGVAWLGTTPGYGLRDGALTRVDLASGDATVIMFPDETVAALAVDHGATARQGTPGDHGRAGDHAVLVGTSPEAGTGTPEHDGSGRLLRLATDGTELRSVPAPHDARFISDITRVGDAWWLLADHWLCRFDPVTLETAEAHQLAEGANGRGQILAHGSSLLVLTGGTVRQVEPGTGQAAVLADEVLRMAITDDALWCVVRPEAGGAAATDFLRIDLLDLS
ncbi:hypothetical protein ACQBAU_18330 [Propionibacteriaceae bacterium Y2011]